MSLFHSRVKIGAFFALLSSFFYSLLGALVKGYNHTIPLPIVMFFQSFIPLFILIFMHSLKKNSSLKELFHTQKIRWHVLRAILSMGISFFLFLSLHYIPLVDTVLLSSTSALLLPFIAWIFLSKPINHKFWFPLAIGFIGIIIVLNPGRELFHPASLIALVSALCMAAATLALRYLSTTEKPYTTMAYYFLFYTITMCILTPFFWISLNHTSIFILSIGGVLFFLTQYFLVLALKNASAELVITLYYSNIIFSAMLGYFLFNNPIHLHIVLGIILIISGGALCVRLENRKV